MYTLNTPVEENFLRFRVIISRPRLKKPCFIKYKFRKFRTIWQKFEGQICIFIVLLQSMKTAKHITKQLTKKVDKVGYYQIDFCLIFVIVY